ncbi:hypothetical protein PoB_001868300, partial [Plakobranchus ocellatus]
MYDNLQLLATEQPTAEEEVKPRLYPTDQLARYKNVGGPSGNNEEPVPLPRGSASQIAHSDSSFMTWDLAVVKNPLEYSCWLSCVCHER